MFELHPTLAKDSVDIARLDLCRVLLIRDKTYPWVVLVPERPGLRDLDDLSEADRIQAMAEIDAVSKALKALYQPHKINVAALGNVVEQLHIHIIARFADDPAWPGPVWGAVEARDYDEDARAAAVSGLRRALDGK